ncbi:hypothetical protein niasHS_001642 [Heterodera schachtii]|uniref:RNA helicase n=1 Tax=Heterodera schachtii TaxID=97005 RepID=A0ABD2KE13_HETSC
MVSRSKKFCLPDDLFVDRSSPSADSLPCHSSTSSQNYSNSAPSNSRPKSTRQKFDLPSLSVDQLVSEQNQQIIGPDFELHQNVSVTVRGGKSDNGDQYQISSFQEANLSRQILQNLAQIRFHRPTVVQSRVIPLILQANEDLLCLASTGTGKTGAFLIPLLNILHNSSDGFLKSATAKKRSPKAIVIAHTKELVLQIDKTARILADGTGLGIVLMMGELSYTSINSRIYRDGCDLLVGTPGRLKEFIRKNWIDLDNLQFLVVDEMDKFFSDIDFVHMFREMTDKRNECKNAFPCRTFLFSATLTSREEILPYLRPDFFYVEAGQVGQSVAHVQQHIISATVFTRKQKLEFILKKEEINGTCKKTVIFVNECRRCDRLAIMLCYYGYKAISINGHHSLEQRTNAMAHFNAGTYEVLVGTDVIARGMNIPNLSRVILYEMPPLHRYEQFVHRVGRVGRSGNVGEAFVFFNPEDPNDMYMAEFLRDQLVQVKQNVPKWLHELVETQHKWQKETDEVLTTEKETIGSKRTTQRKGTTTGRRADGAATELDEDQDEMRDDASFANSDWN